MKFAKAIYWALFGAWIEMEVALWFEAGRESGGAMPIAFPLFVLFLIGGLALFLLLHCVIRRIDNRLNACKCDQFCPGGSGDLCAVCHKPANRPLSTLEQRSLDQYTIRHQRENAK
jgi:hypothetical protein